MTAPDPRSLAPRLPVSARVLESFAGEAFYLVREVIPARRRSGLWPVRPRVLGVYLSIEKACAVAERHPAEARVRRVTVGAALDFEDRPGCCYSP